MPNYAFNWEEYKVANAQAMLWQTGEINTEKLRGLKSLDTIKRFIFCVCDMTSHLFLFMTFTRRLIFRFRLKWRLPWGHSQHFFLPLRHSGDFTDCHTSLLEPLFPFKYLCALRMLDASFTICPCPSLSSPSPSVAVSNLKQNDAFPFKRQLHAITHHKKVFQTWDSLDCVIYQIYQNSYFMDVYKPAKVCVCVCVREGVYTASGIMC